MRRGGIWLIAVAGALALVAAGWLLQQEPAHAHAILVRSNPDAGAELERPPAAIDLWFSEPLEAAFSTFELLDSTGDALRVDGIEVDARDEYHLTGLPRGIGPGYYTVVYRNVSQADGHEWSGAYSFIVLNADGSLPSGQAFDAGGLGRTTSPENVAGRWLSFLGFALLSGGLFLYVPLYRRRRRMPVVWSAFLGTSARVALAGLPLLVAGTVLVVLAQVNAVASGGVWDILGGTRAGTLWLWRLLAIEVAAILVGLALYALHSRRERSAGVALGGVLVAGAAGLLTITLLSHAAAAPGSTWAMLFDYVHLLVASWWLGGVAVLAALLVVAFRAPRASREEVRAIVVPFSVAAAISVYVLVATGIVRTLGEVPSLATLWDTGYGRWLIVKIALVAGILTAAFINRRTVDDLRSGGRDDAAATVVDLRSVLPVELVLGAVILLAVGALGQTPTPRGEAIEVPQQVAEPFNEVQQTDGMNAHLQVTPATVGSNDLRLHFYTDTGAQPAGIRDVRVTFLRPGSLGGDQDLATAEGAGVYRVSSSALSQALTWTVQVDVTREGQDDLRLAYQVPVTGPASSGGGSALGSPAPQIPTNMLWLLLAGLTSGGIFLLGPRRSRYRVSVHFAGVVILGLGVMAAVAGGGESADPFASNPSPGDPESIARGGTLYALNCIACHGTGGAGDGPVAPSLDPPPADFRVHVPAHPDSELYAFITNGIEGTAMPAWEERLTPQERWDVVNYLISQFGSFSP